MSQVLTLYRLQQIDSQLDQIRSRSESIHLILDNHDQVTTAALKSDQLAEKLNIAGKDQLSLEEELKLLRIKIEQTDSDLYGGKVRSPKELQDLQNEAASLRRHATVLEDRLLEIMLLVEDIQTQHASAQASLATVRSDETSNNLHLEKELSELEKELSKLSTQRSAIIDSLEAKPATLYENLRKQRHGLAVTTISENACSACGTPITLALQQAARSPANTSTCPSCSRILYVN